MGNVESTEATDPNFPSCGSRDGHTLETFKVRNTGLYRIQRLQSSHLDFVLPLHKTERVYFYRSILPCLGLMLVASVMQKLVKGLTALCLPTVLILKSTALRLGQGNHIAPIPPSGFAASPSEGVGRRGSPSLVPPVPCRQLTWQDVPFWSQWMDATWK